MRGKNRFKDTKKKDKIQRLSRKRFEKSIIK